MHASSLRRVLTRCVTITSVSVLVSVLLVLALVSASGRSADAGTWLLAVAGPMLIAFPATVYILMQSEQLRLTHLLLVDAHAALAKAPFAGREGVPDQLTGMLNRDAFLARHSRGVRGGVEGALLMVDATVSR